MGGKYAGGSRHSCSLLVSKASKIFWFFCFHIDQEMHINFHFPKNFINKHDTRLSSNPPQKLILPILAQLERLPFCRGRVTLSKKTEFRLHYGHALIVLSDWCCDWGDINGFIMIPKFGGRIVIEVDWQPRLTLWHVLIISHHFYPLSTLTSYNSLQLVIPSSSSVKIFSTASMLIAPGLCV